MAEEKKMNWQRLEHPPESALKTITGGRLSGMTDINPQWRYKAMTEVYGECGVGWKWEIVKLWAEPGSAAGEVFAFAQVAVSTLLGDEWAAPIPGIGGSMLIAREKSGLFANDDAFKMAVTDALSVALKFLGVGSLVYEGNMEGKYAKPAQQQYPVPLPTTQRSAPSANGDEIHVLSVDSSKKGKSKRGDWTLHRIELSDGRVVSTFDGADANLATLSINAFPVKVTTEQTDRGENLLSIEAIGGVPAADNTDLPF